MQHHFQSFTIIHFRQDIVKKAEGTGIRRVLPEESLELLHGITPDHAVERGSISNRARLFKNTARYRHGLARYDVLPR